MSLIDRLRLSLGRTLLTAPARRTIMQKMARQLLPVISPWKTATFLDADFPTLDAEAYKGNSAVFACTSVLSFGFIEPSLRVYDADKEEIVTHPTRELVIRPNDIMGEGELMLHTITYMAIGGNAYWHKMRNSQKQVIGLIPYHIGNLLPVPNSENVPDDDGQISWILRYDYDDGTGKKTPIDKKDIVHFKWPSVDMYQPWMAMPPLLPALREVATDNEAVRFLKAVLQNDAVPRMVMYVPPESNLDLDDPEKIERFKAQFRQKYGGDSRGNLAIITGGAKVERISLNMEELNFDAISRIPESRISADLRVPAMLAGLNTGMARSTFNNTSEAREFFTRNTLSALWKLSSSEIAADKDLNPNGDTIGFDMNEVQVLQEDANNKWARLTAGLVAGGLMINDFRRGVGLTEVERGNVFLIPSSAIPTSLEEAQPDTEPTSTKDILGYHIEQGVVSRNEARATLGLPPENESESDNLRRLTGVLTVLKLALDARITPEVALRLVGLTGVTIDEPEPPVPLQLPPQVNDEPTADPQGGLAEPGDANPVVEDNTNGKGHHLPERKESDSAHIGVFINLACPVCYHTGATLYEDHKGLCVCTHCGCTFDPAIEVAL